MQTSRSLKATLLVAVSCVAVVGCSQKSKTTTTNPSALRQENLVAVNQNEPPIVDNDYRFQLKSPSRKWKLLPLDQAQGLLADASAGMVRMGLPGDGAAYGLVVVEPIGDTNLSAYSELLKDSFTDAGHQLKPPERYEVAGKPAVRYRSILQSNGLKYEYSLIGFVHQRHGYQLLMWAPLNTLNANLTSEFVGAFSLLDGKVRGRANARKLGGFRAVGKRVVDGRYESPVSRLIVEPRKPWHLLVGSTLTQLNAEADVGMQNDLASAYLVIVPERIVGLEVGKYTKQVRETFAGALAEEGSSTKHLDPLKTTIDGVEVEFARYVAGKSLRFEYSHCVCVRDGWAYQITVWWLENRRQDAKQLLADAMSGIRFLTPPQAQALEKELLALPDPENAVGPGWGIRRGVYRDFNLGMIWKKPVGFWRVLAGDDAANFSEDSRVWASENRLGLTLDISAKPADGRSLMKVHQDVAKLYFAADAKSVVKPARIEIDGRPALLSIEDQVVDRLAFHTRLHTTIVRGTAIQIRIFGSPSAMKENGSHVDAVIRGFRFPQDQMKPEQTTANMYRNSRIGIELSMPGRGWSVQSQIDRRVAAVGCDVSFKRPNQEIRLIAMTSLLPGQDASVLVKVVKQFLVANLSNFAGSKPVESRRNFASLEWKVQSWRNGTDVRSFLHATRDRTVYFLLVAERQVPGRMPLLDQTVSGFRLVD